MFVERRVLLAATVDGRALLLLAASLRALTQSVALHARFAVASTDAVFAAQELAAAQRDAAALTAAVDLFAYGNAAAGAPSALASSAAAHRLLLVNGCVDNGVGAAACANYGGAPCVFYYTMALCAKDPASTDAGAPVFDFGLVGTGLLPALRGFLTDAGDLLRVRAAQLAAAPPLAAGASLDAPPGAYVDALGAAYLPAGLGALVAELAAESAARMAAFNAWSVGTIAASSLALVFAYAVVYAPILAQLDNEIKRTRFLLLLFPEDVARRVAAVGDAARRLLQQAGQKEAPGR